jgi:hypothetical protein
MAEIANRRLVNQQLHQAQFTTPVEVVAWSGAVQSQEYAGAKWSLAQRLPGITEAELDGAFDSGAILRTHVMRPTWHFVAPADIRWLLALTGPRIHAISDGMYRSRGLDAAVFKRTQAILTKALQGGQTLTRNELAAILKKAGIEPDGVGMAYILMQAEITGLVCSGPRRGKQFTYALLEERVPTVKALSRHEALAELTRRYFTSHGPALPSDFARWSGLTLADTKAGLEMNTQHLASEVINGKTYWASPNTPMPAKPSTTLFLLPTYDEYLVGYKDFSAAIDEARAKLLDGPTSAYYAMIVSKGRIIGTWRRTFGKGQVIIQTRPFEPLTATEHKGLALAAKKYGEFLNLQAVIVPEKKLT